MFFICNVVLIGVRTYSSIVKCRSESRFTSVWTKRNTGYSTTVVTFAQKTRKGLRTPVYGGISFFWLEENKMTVLLSMRTDACTRNDAKGWVHPVRRCSEGRRRSFMEFTYPVVAARVGYRHLDWCSSLPNVSRGATARTHPSEEITSVCCACVKGLFRTETCHVGGWYGGDDARILLKPCRVDN